MGDETTTGTEAGAEDQGTETSSETAASTPDRSKELEDRLATRGREAKAAKERADKAEAELARLKEERDRLWYEHEASDAEKETYRTERAQAKTKKEDPEVARVRNENALLKAIAQEDNSSAKKALQKMYSKAEASGVFPDKAAIDALRESFEDDDESDADDKQESKKKDPPKVSASRGTTSATPSLDQQIEQVKKDIKAGKASTSDLYPLLQQKSQQPKG